MSIVSVAILARRFAVSSPPPAADRLGRLADFAFRRRRTVLVAWIAGLVAAFAATALAGDWSADYSTPGSESRAAAELLKERFPQQSPDTVDVVWQAPAGAGTPAVRARIDRLVAQSRGLEGIGGSAGSAQISRDGTIGVLRIGLDELPGGVPDSTGKTMIDLAQRAGGDGLRVELDGQIIANAQRGAISSEAVGILIAALVLLLTFGSLPGCRWPRRCSGSGSPPRSSGCSPRSRRCPTGRRRSPRCSASAWGSTTRC
jgi:RND superfamily putative drug exporter